MIEGAGETPFGAWKWRSGEKSLQIFITKPLGCRKTPFLNFKIHPILVRMVVCCMTSCATIETLIKEPRVLLINLDRFLINGLVFFIPAYKVLNKVLIYSTCFACIYTVFRTRILDDS